MVVLAVATWAADRRLGRAWQEIMCSAPQLSVQLRCKMNTYRYLSEKGERRSPQEDMYLVNWMSHRPCILRIATQHSHSPPADRDARLVQLQAAMQEAFDLASAYNRANDTQYLYDTALAILMRQWRKWEPEIDPALAGTMALPISNPPLRDPMQLRGLR